MAVNFLQDTRSWILMPTKVEFYISNNHQTFELVDSIDNTIDPKNYDSQIKEFISQIGTKKAQYIKIKAYNFGKLPEWHQGFPFNGEAFIFVDEIKIK